MTYPNDRFYYAAQPVIRLQGEGLVGKIDGFSTSFVNVATEIIGASVDNHLSNIENWFDALSKLGIFVRDLSLKVKRDSNLWGNVPAEEITIKINYMGLEIGVANYFVINQVTREPLVISDLNFGLERLVWAVNKTSSYFDIIGPVTDSALGRVVEMDSYRTMVLMALGGVKPGNRDRGSKFRILAKKISSPKQDVSEGLLRYYYDWWNRFLSSPKPYDDVEKIIRRERNRNVNSSIRNAVRGKHSLSVENDPERYVELLVASGVDIELIKSIISKT